MLLLINVSRLQKICFKMNVKFNCMEKLVNMVNKINAVY